METETRRQTGIQPRTRYLHAGARATAARRLGLCLLAISRKTLTDAIVKLEITVAPAQKSLVSERQIRQLFVQAEVAHVARIVIETPEQKENRKVDVTRSDDIPPPLVALEKYLRKKEQSEQELALILELGRTIIESRDGA